MQILEYGSGDRYEDESTSVISNELVLNYYFTQFDDQLRQKIFDTYQIKLVEIKLS